MDPNEPLEPAPDQAPAADLPTHARERLLRMHQTRFFTSDLSVNEFLLVKEAGFEPLGLVMGSSIYHVAPRIPSSFFGDATSCELEGLTQALYHSRDLAMTRLEEEAEVLGADGVIGVRLDVNLHAWGRNVAEFVAVGTAVRRLDGAHFRNKKGRPFTSDLSGQDFWTLVRAGYKPVGLVMGNCAYYVAPQALSTSWFLAAQNQELVPYTHSFYDARELAVERLQAEAEALEATGIVGVTLTDQQHSWRGAFGGGGSGGWRGELLEFFVLGTAVVPTGEAASLPKPTLAIHLADPEAA